MPDRCTILLTGGTGFLGSHIIAALVGNQHDVILLKRSTSDTTRVDSVLKNIVVYDIDRVPLEKPFQEHNISIIIHCAADRAKDRTDPERILETNVLFPVRLLQLGRRYEIKGFINTDTMLDRKVDAYALSKHQFREWFKIFEDNMICINIALELFYGPHDRETNFVPSVIRALLRKAEKIDLTAGDQKRDFVYIADVVDAFLRLIDYSKSLKTGFHKFQVGTGKSLSIREIVTVMKSLTGNTRTNLNFGTLPYRKHEVMESRVDISGLRKLGWEPRYSLKEGLQATIDAERARLYDD